MPTPATRYFPHHHRRQNALLPREPGLINLPIPLPSIPILNPILTPLIQGAQAKASPSATPLPTSTPSQETPTAADPSPTNNGETGDGGQSGNEGSGGEGSSGEVSSGEGSSGDVASDTIVSSPSPSTGEGESNGGSTGITSAVGENGATESVSGIATPSSTGDSGNFLFDQDTPVNDSDDSKSGSGSGTGSASVGSGDGNGNENSGSAHAGITIVSGVTGVPTATGVDSGTSGGKGGGNGSGNIGTGGVGKHGLSGGAIGGIIGALLLIAAAVAVVLLRRRFKLRRSEHRKRWWYSRNGTSQTYGDREAGVSSDGRIVGNQRKSVRSSFETTVDFSASPRLGEGLLIPSLPPMAELRGSPLLVNLDNSMGPGVARHSPDAQIKITPESRFSIGTVSSIDSDGQGQLLTVKRDYLAPEIGTPMSVRPFSPSESFAFPKPPTEKSSGDLRSPFSRPRSSNASFTKNPHSHGIGTRIAEEEVPALPVPSPAANPFNDPDPIALYSTIAASLGVAPGSDIPGAPVGANVVVTNDSNDPFADPDPKTRRAINSEFMEIESIKRPFVPSLDDELRVDPGDKVRILRLFDDGWALVEKSPICGQAGVKGKGREPEKGLIPIDCLRDYGVELSAFLERLNIRDSYGQSRSKHIGEGAAF